jgi:hypothetical protein
MLLHRVHSPVIDAQEVRPGKLMVTPGGLFLTDFLTRLMTPEQEEESDHNKNQVIPLRRRLRLAEIPRQSAFESGR